MGKQNRLGPARPYRLFRRPKVHWISSLFIVFEGVTQHQRRQNQSHQLFRQSRISARSPPIERYKRPHKRVAPHQAWKPAPTREHRCTTQLPGDSRTANRVRSHCRGGINSRMLTVSPVLHIAVFTSHPSSRDQGAFRGSRVSGNNARQVGNEVESSPKQGQTVCFQNNSQKAGFTFAGFPAAK